jgi:hypothetical protein
VDIPKFQFLKIGQSVGRMICERLTALASAMSHETAINGVFLILPAVPAKRWNLGILE